MPGMGGDHGNHRPIQFGKIGTGEKIIHAVRERMAGTLREDKSWPRLRGFGVAAIGVDLAGQHFGKGFANRCQPRLGLRACGWLVVTGFELVAYGAVVALGSVHFLPLYFGHVLRCGVL